MGLVSGVTVAAALVIRQSTVGKLWNMEGSSCSLL